MICVSLVAVQQPMNLSQTEGEPEGKTEITKPLRIKAAPLLTRSWLPSTTRSIFKHNIHCSVFLFRFASSCNHKAWMKTPLKSTAIRTAHTKQTRKHSQRHWLGLQNPCGCLLACVHSRPQSVCWKPDQRGHYWRQLDWSAAAYEREVCLSPFLTLFFFLLPSSFWISLLCLSSHLSRAISSLAFQQSLQRLFHHSSSGSTICSSEHKRTHTYMTLWCPWFRRSVFQSH